jgi:hypothetical protein
MAFVWDTLTALNLVFCVVIVALGYWAYRKKGNIMAIYIALAFGLFGISHLAILLGAKSSEISLWVIRALGYIVVILALYRAAFSR